MTVDDTRRLVLELLGLGATQAELPRAGVLTIGSAASKVGFVVQGQGVSEVHCAIGRAKGGGFALKDLGSEYGTWVNGERVQQAKLDVGDVILVGSRRLRVVDPAAPPLPELVPNAQAAAAPAPAPVSAAAAPTIPAPAASPKPASATTSYEQTPLPKISGYRIEKLLGRGGMGEVFLATQERLDRKVALKLLSSKLCADADFVRRFKDEARAAAALTHPNVVVVHDVGEESGRHFLSMEFMDKGTLEARVARGARMGWAEVLGVLHDMSSALVYAESRGIVHRDLKPANMMQGAAGATKLADLGLATQIEAEASDSDNGKIFGTPHFISPEQARGERVDGRADLYSLGATAYRLLSGRTPFEGATTRDILRGHFFDKPKPLTDFEAQLPPELVRIVDRLLEKKPDDRYPSAAALLKEVDRVRANLLHSDAPAPARGKHNKLVVRAGLILFAVLAVWWFTRPGPTPSTSAKPQVAPVTAPPIATAPPVEQIPAPSKPVKGSDDDTRLKLFEAQAKLAWKELPSDLAPVERVARLMQLSADFAGTTAAADMQVEADQIRATQSQQSAVSAAQGERRQGVLSALEATLATVTNSSAITLSALNTIEIPAELSTDEAFKQARAGVYQRALAAGLAAAQAALKDIDECAGRGDFEAVGARIYALQTTLQLPALPENLAVPPPAEYAALQALAQELKTRREGLELERTHFASARVDADRQTIAKGLGFGAAFEAELKALDFALLHTRLEKLEAALTTEPARVLVHELDADLSRAHAALRLLAVEFSAGAWKRKQVADPRGIRSAVRDAIGVDESGVTLDVGGKAELVAWSNFGGRPEKLSFLFNERLSRAYSAEEALGIEALIRSAAVLAAVQAASEMFDPTAGARFDESEVREMNEAFEWDRQWATLAGCVPRYERESKAAALLAQSLHDASQNSWSASVAGLDRLLREFGDTLLVRMLSSGAPLSAH